MASAPSEPRRVTGRIDSAGRLIAADPELEALQREAGSSLGQPLALPQLAAVAQVARKLGTPVSRPALAASAEHDIELLVHAIPEGDDILLSLDGWTARPPAGPRLGSNGIGASDPDATGIRCAWAMDEELRVISLSSDLAELLGIEAAKAAGLPLTRLVRLEEDEAGDLPLMAAVSARRSFSGQRAHSRAESGRTILLSGEIVTAADGGFAGFRGTAEAVEANPPDRGGKLTFDYTLDDVLRSPLDRIIENAELIVERSDGPLRNDYASYGSDIAAAARHLLSVLRGMSEAADEAHESIDLASLAAEATVMLESSAEERKVTIAMDPTESLPAKGQERSVIQILVNLMSNAIRHSPEGGKVRVSFGRGGGNASVTVSDQGPGIAAADQQRIFERFERGAADEAGTGLGLAISRRLARSMGGDVTLDSAPGEGARFTLRLASA